MLGERTTEEIKMAVGSAYPSPGEPHAEIRGRNLVSGLPKTIVICAEEVRHAIQGPVSTIVDIIETTLDKCPPELAGDIMDRGITLTGGGALLRGLDKRLREETGCRSTWPEIRWSRSCSARASALRTSMPSGRCWYRTGAGSGSARGPAHQGTSHRLAPSARSPRSGPICAARDAQSERCVLCRAVIGVTGERAYFNCREFPGGTSSDGGRR